MRCPKCGFISFDHLEACLKCGKDITSTAENLHGSVYNVAAPAFLKFSTEPEADEVELDEAFIEEDEAFADEEIRDPDLDILIDEDHAEEDEGIPAALNDQEDEVSIDFSQAADDEEGIDFNFGDVEEDAELGDADDAGEDRGHGGNLNIELPEELSDISDLEPPAAPVAIKETAATVSGDQDLDLDFDLNLDDDELGEVAEQARKVDLADLSLQDLEFEEPLPEPATRKKPPAAKLDLDDEEFTFDLDLGDLKLDDDE